jgi:hypothetical protein
MVTSRTNAKITKVENLFALECGSSDTIISSLYYLLHLLRKRWQ